MQIVSTNRRQPCRAFTLVEMLVVIAVIAILAALIAPLAGNASKTGKINRTKAELAQLETAIEAYKNKKGFYPPSNANSTNAMWNPLFYELTGTLTDKNQTTYQRLHGTETISAADIQAIFGIGQLSA